MLTTRLSHRPVTTGVHLRKRCLHTVTPPRAFEVIEVAATCGPDAQEAKRLLKEALAGTSRGGTITRQQRGAVEEAQVALESFAPDDLDFELLEGTWRMIYTTAPDVAPLVAPPTSQGSPLPLRIGAIYQRFSGLEEGTVENIIKFSLPGLVEGDGATLRVGASYEPRGRRSIILLFEDIRLGEVRISEGLQGLLAPAMLPRGWLNQQLLLAIQEFSFRLPLNARPALGLLDSLAGGSGSSSSSSSSPQRVGGGYYQLSYLDEDTLVGRQQAGGGTFIFTRDAEGM